MTNDKIIDELSKALYYAGCDYKKVQRIAFCRTILLHLAAIVDHSNLSEAAPEMAHHIEYDEYGWTGRNMASALRSLAQTSPAEQLKEK